MKIKSRNWSFTRWNHSFWRTYQTSWVNIKWALERAWEKTSTDSRSNNQNKPNDPKTAIAPKDKSTKNTNTLQNRQNNNDSKWSQTNKYSATLGPLKVKGECDHHILGIKGETRNTKFPSLSGSTITWLKRYRLLIHWHRNNSSPLTWFWNWSWRGSFLKNKQAFTRPPFSKKTNK